MTPEERAELERLLQTTAPSEWGQQSKWLSDFGRMDDGRVYGPQQFDLGAEASLMNPFAFEEAEKALRADERENLVHPPAQNNPPTYFDLMEDWETSVTSNLRRNDLTMRNGTDEERVALNERISREGSTYTDVWLDRGMPEGLATIFGLGSALTEFDAGLGTVADATRFVRALPEIIAMLPKVPIEMQKLLAKALPDMLVDQRTGTPLRVFHATGTKEGLVGEIAVASGEQHGHWVFAGSPMVENSFEYWGRRGGGQGQMVEGVMVPRTPDSIIQSNKFPGNDAGGIDGDYRTFRNLTPEQQGTVQQIADELVEMARLADLEYGRAPMHPEAFQRDLVPRIQGLIHNSQDTDIVNVLNQFEAWGRTLSRASSDAHTYRLGVAGITNDGGISRIRGQRFLPNDTPALPDIETPAGTYSDYANRLGFDVGLGPLTDNTLGDVSFAPRNETFATEIVSYRPGDNFIQTNNVSIQQIADDMVRMGIATRSEVQAAMNSPIPETNFLLGNEVIDVDQAAILVAHQIDPSVRNSIASGRLTAEDVGPKIFNALTDQLGWSQWVIADDVSKVPGIDALVDAIWEKAKAIVMNR